jgi:uncharacterized protein YjbI with pentapeptide repeats
MLPVIVMFFILVLNGCAPNTRKQLLKEGQQPLSAEELFTLITDNSLHLESTDFSGTVFFQNDGYLAGQDRLNNRDTGKWDISSEGMLCLKFRVWYYGDTKCYSIFANENADSFIFFTENGARYYTADYMTADPENLGTQIRKSKKKTFVREQLAEQTRDTGTAESYSSSNTTAVPPPSMSAEDKDHTMIQLARNCPDCNLAGVDLKKAQLIGANLAGANLSGADLSGANLRRADLTGADLSGAKLLITNLAGAILVGTNLANADLTGSNLIKANLTGANTDGTIFTGTHLESVEGYK